MAVHENNNYIVVLDTGTYEGDTYNWAVINKTHSTVECRLVSLPAAVFTADCMNADLEKFTKKPLELVPNENPLPN